MAISDYRRRQNIGEGCLQMAWGSTRSSDVNACQSPGTDCVIRAENMIHLSRTIASFVLFISPMFRGSYVRNLALVVVDLADWTWHEFIRVFDTRPALCGEKD